MPFLSPPKKKCNRHDRHVAMMSPSAPSFHADARSCNREMLGPSDLNFEGIVAHGWHPKRVLSSEAPLKSANQPKQWPIFEGQITQNCQQQMLHSRLIPPTCRNLYHDSWTPTGLSAARPRHKYVPKSVIPSPLATKWQHVPCSWHRS